MRNRSRQQSAPVRAALLASTLVLVARGLGAVPPPPLSFVDVTAAAGVTYVHGLSEPTDQKDWISGGVAAGDYDRDGWIDLYVVAGDAGTNRLFRNLGDGTFDDVATAAGVAVAGEAGAGPVFGDVDGDGWLDLFIGGVRETSPRLFRNKGDGTFEDITTAAGIQTDRSVFSCSFGDPDRDGDLDMFWARWRQTDVNCAGGETYETCTGCAGTCDGHLWLNDGSGGFTESDAAAGISAAYQDFDFSFAPNFADVNDDLWPDLLVASDFNSSKIFLNQGDPGGDGWDGFLDATDEAVITDEFGMGAAVGDFDNDLKLDWFVSSIYDTPPIHNNDNTGNRLYRGNGDGTFVEVSDGAGVRIGYWGWGSCFGDFDNDTLLDIFHVNGFFPGGDPAAHPWTDDPSRLFMSNGGLPVTFTERSAEYGLLDTGQGRGVVCFDFDRDGDLDLFVANNSGPASLYRNDGGNVGNFLILRLQDHAATSNPSAVGARAYVTAGGLTQMREVRAGSNFESQQPLDLHFGLADTASVDELVVEWPDGTTEIYHGADDDPMAANQFLGLGRGREPCPVHLEIADRDLVGPETIEACNTITVGPAVRIHANGDVHLRAGREIVFGEGFSVAAGCELAAETIAALRIP